MDNTNFNFGEDLKNRTKKFAVKIISFTKDLDKSTENYVFTKQIIRSASSVASNYRAACRGRSKAEFYAKLSIVIEEADETLYWLDLIKDLYKLDQIFKLRAELIEIIKIVSTIVIKLKAKQKDENLPEGK